MRSCLTPRVATIGIMGLLTAFQAPGTAAAAQTSSG